MLATDKIKAHATERTALQETLFAVGFAIKQTRGIPLTSDMLLDVPIFMEAFHKFVKSNRNPEAVYDFAINENDWVDSVVKGVNILRKYRILQNGIFRIFRGKEIMEDVYKRKNEMFQKDRDLPKLANDKWNPGDIWLAKMRRIPNFNSIYEYNEFIGKSLNSGALIGVSLKKSNNPRIYYVKKDTDPMLFEYDSVAKPQSPFNTGITIKTTDGKTSINVRSFRTSHQAPITSEIQIKGSSARHGKAALTGIIQKFGIKQTPKGEISMYSTKNIDVLKYMVRDMWKTLGYNYSDKEIDKFWEMKIAKKEVDSMVGFFMSIINSLEIGCFLKRDKNKADDIVTAIIREAASKSELSSEFLKVM